MSTYKYVSLRDCPHEFIITIGGGVKRDRTRIERIINWFKPVSTDYELFFSLNYEKWKELDSKGLTLTYCIHFDDINTSMEDIAIALQQQPSKSQARKNGWSGPIPDGYSEFKRKFHKFYILKLPISTNDLVDGLPSQK